LVRAAVCDPWRTSGKEREAGEEERERMWVVEKVSLSFVSSDESMKIVFIPSPSR
jgi:hypothetical protein